MSFSITILGSSSALPTSERFPSAQVLNVSERFFLIDCGEGTQIQLRKLKVRFARINHIFISHLHTDHYLGIYGLLSSFALMGRKNPVHLYCHEELKDLIDYQFKYYNDQMSYEIVYHFLQPGKAQKLLDDDRIEVESFPLDHRIPTCGFIFKEKPKELKVKKDLIDIYNLSIKDIIHLKQGGHLTKDDGTIINNSHFTIEPEKPRKYVYCSDTIYSEKLIPVIQNADLLYHEATFAEREIKRAKETYHSTTIDAANIALKSNAKRLMIGHYSARYKNTDFLVDEAKKIFPDVVAAYDGLEIHL